VGVIVDEGEGRSQIKGLRKFLLTTVNWAAALLVGLFTFIVLSPFIGIALYAAVIIGLLLLVAAAAVSPFAGIWLAYDSVRKGDFAKDPRRYFESHKPTGATTTGQPEWRVYGDAYCLWDGGYWKWNPRAEAYERIANA
jgi:hypothetical protein